jgi:hypothetical protein
VNGVKTSYTKPRLERTEKGCVPKSGRVMGNDEGAIMWLNGTGDGN